MAYHEDSVEGRLLAGDPLAVGTVFRWIAIVLARPRFWALRDEWDDLHQEIVTRVLHSLRAGRFDASRSLQAYVQGVARYAATEALQAHFARHAEKVLSEERVGRRPGIEERIARVQFARAVLDSASEECRGLIRSYFLEEKSYAEIAATTGWPVGTVKSRLARCLEKVHRGLGRRAPGRRRLLAGDRWGS